MISLAKNDESQGLRLFVVMSVQSEQKVIGELVERCEATADKDLLLFARIYLREVFLLLLYGQVRSFAVLWAQPP